MATEIPSPRTRGWRLPAGSRSLPEVHGSIALPHNAGFWRKVFVFAGPGYLVAVGYMDPGNWATDLAGGARYGYALLSVIMISNFMAILLQALAARLGIASGRDLAQACRDSYSRPTVIALWIACEIAIAACDLAEVLGSAVALNLLFNIPLFWCVIITAFDVLLLLGLQRFGMRMIEAVISVLILTIGVCYFIELFVLHQTRPNFLELGQAILSPSLAQAGMAYVAIGIIGATVMPHNLYLHSALVQSRKLQADDLSI